jgi:hypothetical protein
MADRPSLTTKEKISRALFAYFKQGNRKKSSELCRQILADNPRNFLALYLAGLLAYRPGHEQRAFALMDEALRIEPAFDAFGFTERLFSQMGAPKIRIASEKLYNYWIIAVSAGLFVSYPKCGRTWVNMFLTRYLRNEKEKKEPPAELKDFIRVNSNGVQMNLNFTHDDFPHQTPWTALFPDKSAYRGKRVVFLARDPRDVVVSYYFQYTRRGGKEKAGGKFTGTLSDFIHYEIGGIRSIVGFYNIWANSTCIPAHFMALRYEDLRGNPEKEFTRLLDFLGLPDLGRAAFDDALEYSSFENMKQLERSGAVKSRHLAPPVVEGDPEGFKVRRGIVGGYKDYLSADDQRFLNEYINANLADYFACYKYG